VASARLCRPGGGIVGVELQGPRVGGECIPPALIGAGAVEAPAEEVLIVRLGRCRCRRTWPARAILREKFTLQCLCHGRRDFILYLEHPGLFPVEGRRPKETTVGNADQLCRDPNPLAFSLEATLQDVGDVELVADVPEVLALALERERGGPGDDLEVLDMAQCVQDGFGNAVREVILERARVRGRRREARRPMGWSGSVATIPRTRAR